ncbi:MAG: two-component regulator propeller domain-containing protein [Chitinophagaceae bacterium]
MRKYIFLIAISLINTAFLLAQPHYFRHYQVENGLSNNSIFCILQDKNGFVWFGSKDGLNRFDGYRFKIIHMEAGDESLSRDLILSLSADKKGTIWVGSQKGIFRFDPRSEKLVPFIDTLTGIFDLFFDKDSQLWFTSDNSLYRYNFQKRKLTSFASALQVTSITELPNGKIWVSSSNGNLYEFNPEKETFKPVDLFSHSPKPASRWIEKILSDKNGSIYIGTTSQGIKKFDPVTSTYTDVLINNSDKTSIYVRDIMLARNNEIWFGTESGIFILKTTTGEIINLKKKYLDPYSLSDNAVYALHEDKEGGVWAGTFFGGVNYFPRQYSFFQKFYPDNSKNSISGSAVREICEDNSGNIWIGTEDAGLNKLVTATGDIVRYKPTGEPGSIAYSNIHGLLVDGEDLWVGTFEHGLDILNIRTGKVRKHYTAGPGKFDLISNFIITMMKTKSDDIYLGTSNSLVKYDRLHDNFISQDAVPRDIFVSSLLEDSECTVWVGTSAKGVYFFNPATGKKGHLENIPNDKNSITTNSVNSIFEDSNHNIWFGTEGGGLCQLSKNRRTITRHTTSSGLPSNFIFKVLEDNKKNLWVTTSKGLATMDSNHNIMRVYTRANGLLNDQFNYNSGLKDSWGKLYFGSVRGMITFKPDAFSQSPYAPQVFITGFQVHNKELEIRKDSGWLKQSILFTDKITLPYDHSSFSLDFAAVSFSSPEMTNYSYMMQGLDQEWTAIRYNRTVYFTNLAPGTYTFHLKASSNAQISSAEKKLVIEITPPIWATPGAYLLYAILLISLFYYLISIYHNMLENKKEKEIYEAKIEFFTNVAHEIRTPLTLIKGPVENLRDLVTDVPEIKEDVLIMERNTNRLVNLISQILDFRQTETSGFSLDFSEVNLNEILQESFLTFEPLARKNRLEYHLNLPGEAVIILADAEAMTKIFSNLFSNAVKYAQKAVTIQLMQPARGDQMVTVEVRNDGYLIPENMKEKIFEPFYRLRATAKQKGTGIGLALARSLVALHQGKVYVKKYEKEINIFVVRLPLHAPLETKKLNNNAKTPQAITK